MKVRALVIPIVALTLLAACGGGDDDDGGGGGVAQPSPTGTVTVFNAMEPEEVTALQRVVDDLINDNVQYRATIEGSSQFEEQIKIRVDGGNPPEIAMYPQPGTVVELARQGRIVALEDMGFNAADLERTFGKYFMDLGVHDGKHYGLPTNINLKSMVWYPKKAFDAKGYRVPTTFTELITLSDQIVRDGASPFCIGLESGTATGWPATDWMEDIVLRTAGPDVYDRWVTHQIPFNDPAIVRAGEEFGRILFTPNYVLGGASNTTSINFGDAVDPMFANPPRCYFNRMANFIVSFFPETAVAGVDYDWFPFPRMTQPGDAALFAGELSVVFKDTPAVRDFLGRFSGTEVQCAQGRSTDTSRISPNVNVAPSCYANSQLADASEVLTEALKANTARFDASDLMPSAVGSGSFWTGMVRYVQQGRNSLQGVLTDIDRSWPAS
ncbi:MAG: ABC transporter substrate-binding protein [Acidimicrobiales bacterium]